MDEKTLLIVGNGFDLNLGISTAYKDFMASREFLLISGNRLSQHLRSVQRLQNWVDIEVELSNYCQLLYKPTRRASNHSFKQELKHDYQELKNSLKDYLKRITSGTLTIHTDNYALQLLQDLSESQSDPVDVISFNYTDSIERIVATYHSLPPIKALVYHVHGSLKTDIVFGVDDQSDLEREETYLYKSYSKYKQIRPLARLLTQYTDVVFFGYSLGWTDRQYFQPYFSNLAKDNSDEHNIAIYYHGNEAYNDIKWELQQFTAHGLSSLEMNHNIDYINCEESYRKPSFVK